MPRTRTSSRPRRRRGRRQYLYHPIWREKQDAEKFLRITALGEVIPAARPTVRRTSPSRSSPANASSPPRSARSTSGVRIGSGVARGLRTRPHDLPRPQPEARSPRDRAVPVPREGGIAQDVQVSMPRSRRSSAQHGRSPPARLYAWSEGRRIRRRSPRRRRRHPRAHRRDFTAKDSHAPSHDNSGQAAPPSSVRRPRSRRAARRAATAIERAHRGAGRDDRGGELGRPWRPSPCGARRHDDLVAGEQRGCGPCSSRMPTWRGTKSHRRRRTAR